MRIRDALLMAMLYMIGPAFMAFVLWGPMAQIIVALIGCVALRLRFRIV